MPLVRFAPAFALIASMVSVAALPVMTRGFASPTPSTKQAQTAPSAAPVVTTINYEKRVLPNGLTVLYAQDKRTPTVAIQVWYKVGAKEDPSGRSGFAHLFEHLLFKSTRNMKSEMLDRLTEDVGGENNAYTADDMTVYHETVPSNYLETLLWAEADRMANLNVDEANFKSERAVVQEEYRQSVLSNPYGRLGVLVNEKSFTVHPYKRDTIGSIADLDASTLADVRAFHDAYYRPDNATLVVVGDFDPAQFNGWVDKYFGRISKPSTPILRTTVKEPARTKEARYTVTAPGVPLPALAVTYLVPPATDNDSAALDVADVVLSGGESARLYKSLVYEQQVASSANSGTDLRRDAGLFQLTAVAAGGKSLEAVEKALFAEVDKLRKTPPTAAEMDKARNRLITGALSERETADGQAGELGRAAVVLGDADRVNTEIARLAAVTPADVQRVVQKYLVPTNRVVIRYEKGPDVLEGGARRSPAVPVPPLPASPAPAQTADGPKETPPTPADPRQVTLPTPTEKTLANGLRVVVVPRPGSGLVSVQMAVKAGASLDPENRAGLADFTASLLTKGTTTRTAPQIAEQIEALGGSLSAGAGWDSTTLSLSVLKTRLEAALPLLADVAQHPVFKPEEVERLRTQTLDDLGVSLESPGTLARLAAARVVFGSSPYGHPLGGTLESVKAIAQPEVRGFHAAHFAPGNSVMVFGGDITPDEAFALAQKTLGSWPAHPASPRALSAVAANAAPSASPTTGRVVVIDKPDAGQAAVILARPGIRRADSDYYAGLVANSVLGGGYSSRLNQEIRIKRGLSYGASSGLDARRDVGPFTASAQTRNDAVPEVAGLLKSELDRLATGTVGAEELGPRRATLSGGYARGLQTGAGLASVVASLAVRDLPLTELNNYLPSVAQVTDAQIKDFAASRLSASGANIIIAGDGRKFLPALQKEFPNMEVIPANKLDLNRPDLRKP